MADRVILLVGVDRSVAREIVRVFHKQKGVGEVCVNLDAIQPLTFSEEDVERISNAIPKAVHKQLRKEYRRGKNT